jgi:ribosome assembly protein 1
MCEFYSETPPLEMAAIKTPGAPRGTIQSVIQNGLLSFETRARPLPQPVHEFLLSHTKSIKRLQRDKRTLASSVEEDAAEEHVSEAGGATEEILNPEQFWSKLDKLFSEAGREWAGVSDRIWAFGPRRTGANLMLDDLPGSHRA